ncbi:MAG: 2-oxoacid:acceptor oxidoreductase family protein, partial [Enterocloster asparagiformis]|nr:2-oxoacid:acceptor oxidoreductase family protein [Enterocloster asparagiformis]
VLRIGMETALHGRNQIFPEIPVNVVLLGAAVASGLTGLTMEEMEQAVEKRVPEKFKEMNLKALKLGALAYGRSR